jgi:hypothetical protein
MKRTIKKVVASHPQGAYTPGPLGAVGIYTCVCREQGFFSHPTTAMADGRVVAWAWALDFPPHRCLLFGLWDFHTPAVGSPGLGVRPGGVLAWVCVVSMSGPSTRGRQFFCPSTDLLYLRSTCLPTGFVLDPFEYIFGCFSVRRVQKHHGRMFAKSPCQGAPKKKKSDVPTYLPFLRFFEIFRSDFRKYFYGVFGLLMQRNGQKRDKKKSMGKDERKKVFFSQLFRPKVFDMYFPQKVFYGVFELPLLRNAQKRHKKISKIKKLKRYLPTPFIICQAAIRRFQFYFSSAPLVHFENLLQKNRQKFQCQVFLDFLFYLSEEI